MKPLILCIALCISQVLDAQDSLQYKINLYNSLWVDNAPDLALDYYNQYKSHYLTDAFVVYCSGVAYCLNGNFTSGRKNLGYLQRSLKDVGSTSADDANRIHIVALANKRCKDNCKILDFRNDFDRQFIPKDEIEDTYLAMVSVSPNDERSTVDTEINNKIMSGWHPGGSFMESIPTTKQYTEEEIRSLKERIFEPFNASTIKQRLPIFSSGKDLQIASNDYFNIISFNRKSWNDDELKLRLNSLNKSLSFFIKTYGLVLPLMPTTIYVVDDGYSLSKIAMELHDKELNPQSIGYSLIKDQSVVVRSPDFLLGTINHELMHILSKYNQTDNPLWYEEGLASIYEVAKFDGDSLIGLHNWRHEWLERYLMTELDLKEFSDKYVNTSSDQRPEIVELYQEKLIDKTSELQAKIEANLDPSNFLGIDSTNGMDLFAQQINYAISRYLVMYLLYNNESGNKNRLPEDEQILAKYDDLTILERNYNRSKTDILTFFTWYLEKYYGTNDFTYQPTSLFIKDRLSE